MLTYYSRIKENEDAENRLAYIERATKKNPVGMSVVSVPENMVGSIVDGAKLIAANIGRNFGGDGYYNSKTTQNKAAETIRNTVNQMIDEGVSDEALSQTAQFLYQTGMSMGDMVSAVAVNSIPYIGSALSSTMFFTSSGVSNANRVIENGGTLDDATKTFVATGSAELFFESVSLEQLKAFKQQGVSKVRDVVKNTLKATFTEGSEELFTDVCNAITDQVINGDLSELSIKYNNYIKQGMSDEEAAAAVAGDFATQLGLSFAGGALSGAAVGGAENIALYSGSKIDNHHVNKMIAAQYQQAAQELSEDANFESVKKDLIEQAKNSGDKKAVKMANSFEKTVQRHKGDYSAITVTDVGNLMQVLDGVDTTQTENTQRSGNTAASVKEAPSAVGTGMDQAQRDVSNTQYRATVNRQFTDSGQIKSTAGVNLNAFGKNHAGGISVVEKLNPEVTHDIVRIESSAKEYGSRYNTVTLLTADGKYINADDVQMPTAEQDTLIREAVNYDTCGARALMANYDGYAEYCKQNGKKADVHEYIKQFDALYRLGETGVRHESLQKVGSPRYNKIADIIGAEQAQNALNAGANDVDATFMHESNMRQKVRIPGQKNTAQSKVSVEVGEDFTRAFDDGMINTLQAIAAKTGRDIVLTDKLSEDDTGLFGKDGRIYINANIENSNYAISVALHEAIHSARDVAPMEYLSLERFIVNYLTEKGESIDELLDDIKRRWGKDVRDNYAIREELVAQTVMVLASDDNALRTAIECKENKNLLDKALDALKRIAASVKEFMQGIVKDGKVQGAYNEQAQAWLKDAEALEQLAQRFSELMDDARTEMEESGQKNNTHGVRYSKKGQSQGIFSNKSIDDYTRIQYNSYGWVAVNNVLTVNELNRFYKQFADTKMLDYNYQKSFDGYYMIPTGDISMVDTKIVFVSGTVQDPYIDRVLTLNGLSDDESNFYVNEVIGCGGQFDSFSYLENLTGKRVFKEYTYADFEDYVRRKNRGEKLASSSASNTDENRRRSNGTQKRDGSERRDRDYITAVERGDTATAQRMVDEAAERAFADSKIRDEDGKLLKVYHGSDADFSVFDKTKGRANMDIQGMFFSPWELDASGYGQNVRAFYLNVTNPANESTGYKALNRHMKENNAGVKAREDLERMGYDGVNNEDEEFIAFNSEQIKSADPVTYDDDGNVIPLSERFKTQNKDIRYSKDDTIYDYITDEYGNAESAEDYEKIMEESPRAAVAVIYRNTVQMAQKALTVNGNIKLLEQDYKEIAQKALSSLGVDVYKNSEAADKLSGQIKQFSENVSNIEKGDIDERTKGNYFRLQFEGLCSDLSDYVKLSEQFVSRKRSSVRKDVFDFIGGNTLLLRDIDIPLIQQEYGTVQAFRSRMMGQTQVGYARKNAHGFYIEDFVDYINQKHPDIGYRWGMIDDDGAFSWLDDLVNNYLSPKLQRTANDNTRYYEDENSAGVAAAVQAISDLSQALHEKQGGSSALSKDVSALTQNAYALKNAKLKLAREQSRYRTLKNSFNKELSVREDTIKRDLRREYEDRLTKANTIKGIRRLINRFKSAVMNPTDERFIPPAARKNGVYEAFEALGNAAITRDGTKTAAALGKMLERIDALKNAKIEGEADADYNDEFDADFTLAVTKLRQALEEKYPAGNEEEPSYKTISAKTLTVAEAKQIYDLMREIEGKIIDARKQLLREEQITNRESGKRIIEQVGKAPKDELGLTKIGSTFFNAMRAARMFSRYDDGSEIMYHTNAMNEGRRKGDIWAMTEEKKFNELTERRSKEYRKSLRELVNVDFTDENGKARTIKITRMQGLTILMTWEREMRSGKMVHMRTGGIGIVDSEQERKEHGKIHTNMQKVRGIDARLIAAIDSKMGSFEREYRKLAEEYFNNASKKAINDTMMVLKHREIANSDYYIPVWVDEDFSTAEISALKFDATIEGKGSYKEIVRSTQPIVITSLNRIIAQHIQDTAKLYGIAIPVRNFKRAFRVNTFVAKGDGDNKQWFTAGSVKSTLTEQYGDHAVKFFENVVKDLEAGRNEKDGRITQALYKGRVASALAGNIGVVIKQAASYPTAGRYLSAKSLAAGLGKFTGKSFSKRYSEIIAEIDSHTAQHYIRRKGMSVQEVADMMNSKLYKLPTLINPLKWIQGMDCMTTAALWEAVKAETNTQYRKNGKQVGGEEYWKEVTALYDKVIEDTQPMNDPLHKAEIQKGANALTKNTMMFRTQPLQNTGILFEAISECAVKKGKGGSRKKLAKAVASQATTMLTFIIMTTLADMVRHKKDKYRDENDEITPQSYLSVLGGYAVDNTLTLFLPYGGDYLESLVKDSFSAAQGKWSLSNSELVEAGSLSFLNDIYKKGLKMISTVSGEMNKISTGNPDIGKAIWSVLDFAGSGSQAFGVPYKNLMDLVNSARNYVLDHSQNMGLTDNKGNLITEHMEYHIIQSVKNGDKAEAEKYENLWKAELMKGGKSESKAMEDIKSDLAAALATTDADVTSAFVAYQNGNMAEYSKLFNKLTGYGFDPSDVDKAIESVKTLTYKEMKERGVTREGAQADLTEQGFNEDAAKKLAEGYDKPEKGAPESAFDDTSEGKLKKFEIKDGITALKNGDKTTYEEIRSYVVEHNDKIADNEAFDKKMKSTTYTGGIIQNYLDALDSGKDKERKAYQQQLVNIYGSWDEAVEAINRYRKAKNKK